MQHSLPTWAIELVDLYQSNAANQFIVHGNIHDRMLIPGAQPRLGSITDFLLEVLLPRFDVVLSYDVGNGIRIERGAPAFAEWPRIKENPDLPRNPRQAVEALTHYFRYCANLGRLRQKPLQVACLIKDANLLAPPSTGGLDIDVAATSVLIRDWSVDSALTGHPLATFLLAENLNDIHPLIANNPRTSRVKVGLPDVDEHTLAIQHLTAEYPTALRNFAEQPESLARQLTGATLSAVESRLKASEYAQRPLASGDMAVLKNRMVERDANGLLELMQSTRTLDELHGMAGVKDWLRQDIQLWRQNDNSALPKGYLVCGPVGTGKSFLVECLAGEAGVPVVKLKNFRDKWVGSTEGNLERIFRLLHALGRCYVFIDEADQTLGKRDSASNDSGLSGRVYSMIAEEMGSSASRGRIIWILASSRPDLIEVDLKRPGRIDVTIPLFPSATPAASFQLLSAISKTRSLPLTDADFEPVKASMPSMLTAGAADALAAKMYRETRTRACTAVEALQRCIAGYRPPVPLATLEQQIRIAMRETNDTRFLPPEFEHLMESER